jgi:hypothetical protein
MDGDFNNAFFAQARGRYRAPFQLSTDSGARVPRIVKFFRRRPDGRAGGAVINVSHEIGIEPHITAQRSIYFRDRSLGAADAFVDDGVFPSEPAGGWPCPWVNPDAARLDPHDRQQQVGGTFGGPLQRSKVFFFAGFDQHIFHCAQCSRVPGRHHASISPNLEPVRTRRAIMKPPIRI